MNGFKVVPRNGIALGLVFVTDFLDFECDFGGKYEISMSGFEVL